MLWLGVAGELAALTALQAEAARTLLGTPEERPFVPHVTLGRAKRAGAFDELPAEVTEADLEPFEVTTLTLYESTHHAYRALGSIQSGGAK